MNINSKADSTELLDEAENSDRLETNSDKQVIESAPRTCFSRYFGPIKKGSLRGGTITLFSITFGGGGFLSFPYAISKVGPIIGFIIFVFAFICTYLSLRILLINGINEKILDYNKLILKFLGPRTVFIIDMTNLILCLGILMSYQYIISTLALQLLNYFFSIKISLEVKLIQMLSFMIIIQIPLSLLKNISQLQYLSLGGSAFLFLAIFIILAESPFYFINYITTNTITLFPDTKIGWNWIDSMGIFLFGLAVHNGVFQVYNDLENPTRRRNFKMLNRSICMEIVIYFLLSFAGFFSTFYNTTDIFLTRPDLPGFKDYFIVIVKISLLFTLSVCMAVSYNIMRMSYVSVFFKSSYPSFITDMVITILIYIISNTMTFFIKDAGIILSFFGGIFTVLICYMVPLLVDYKANGQGIYSKRNCFNLSFLLLVSIIGIACSYKSIHDLVLQWKS